MAIHMVTDSRHMHKTIWEASTSKAVVSSVNPDQNMLGSGYKDWCIIHHNSKFSIPKP